jgi:hypothetical protein
VPPANRIPYERYFEVSAVPEPGVSLHSYAYLRRLTFGVLETSPVWDAHAHIGRDRDGRALGVDDLLADLDAYHVDGAVIFPFDDPEQGVDFRVPQRTDLGSLRAVAGAFRSVHAAEPERPVAAGVPAMVPLTDLIQRVHRAMWRPGYPTFEVTRAPEEV